MFFVLLFLGLFVVLSWLPLAGHYALGFFVEPLEDSLLATSVMRVALSAWPFGDALAPFPSYSPHMPISWMSYNTECPFALEVVNFPWRNSYEMACCLAALFFVHLGNEKYHISVTCSTADMQLPCSVTTLFVFFFDLLFSDFSRYIYNSNDSKGHASDFPRNSLTPPLWMDTLR